jgi:NhaA family Na+:H+ antiporter
MLGVRKPAIYALLGICVWAAVLKSGVHATVAGVLFAFTIPARTYIDRAHFLKQGRWLLDRFEAARSDSFEEHAAIHTLETQCDLIQSPLHRIEHSLQPWVAFFVMPVFAFSNAGVHILGNVTAAATNSVSLGVALGLFVGKPIGISLFAWLAAKARLATQPSAVSWGQIFGGSWLCGIGFTMSLFIATLAFGEGSLLDMSKIGTLAASVCAAICGSLFLLGRFGRAPRPLPEDGVQAASAELRR